MTIVMICRVRHIIRIMVMTIVMMTLNIPFPDVMSIDLAPGPNLNTFISGVSRQPSSKDTVQRCLPLHYFQSVFSFVSLSQEITCLISETFSVWEFWAVSFYKNLCLQKYKFHNLSKANIRMFFLSSFRFWFLWLIILAENFKVPHFKNICLILDPNSPLLNNSSTFNNCSILKLAFALIPAKSNSTDCLKTSKVTTAIHFHHHYHHHHHHHCHQNAWHTITQACDNIAYLWDMRTGGYVQYFEVRLPVFAQSVIACGIQGEIIIWWGCQHPWMFFLSLSISSSSPLSRWWWDTVETEDAITLSSQASARDCVRPHRTLVRTNHCNQSWAFYIYFHILPWTASNGRLHLTFRTR